MGSVPSTPDCTDDPWWPIENQNFSLDQSPLSNVVAMDREGHSAAASVDQTDENCAISEVGHSENLNNENQSENNDDSDDGNKMQNVDKREQTLEEFKEELRIKREKRQNAIADLRNEMKSLRQQLAKEKEINRRLRQESGGGPSTTTTIIETEDIFDDISAAISENYDTDQVHNRSSDITLKRELANVQLSLQLANSEVLSLQAELNVRQKQTDTLKEVNIVSKQMIQIREDQLNQVSNVIKEPV